MLLLALYRRYISQSGVSIFDPDGRKIEFVFVRRRFLLYYWHTNVLDGNPLIVGIPLVREKAESLL